MKEIFRMNDIQSKIDEIDAKIKSAYEEINNLNNTRRQLEKINKHYYVAEIREGYGDDYNTEFYPLGFVTEEFAQKWVDGFIDDDEYVSGRCHVVSEEEFKIIWTLAQATQLHIQAVRSCLECTDEIMILIADEREKLASKSPLVRRVGINREVLMP